MPARRSVIALVVLVFAAGAPARAGAVTTCSFGSPTPGYAAVRVDLPQGTDFVSIEPRGIRRSPAVGGEESWHLAQGLLIVNAHTLALEAYRVEAVGTSPRRVVVSAGGTTLNEEAPGTDAPFYHTGARPRAGLPAGTYYLIGFGSDGSSEFPNEWWGGDIRLGGAYSCVRVGEGAGDVFDVDHTDLAGDTHVYAQAAGTAEQLTGTLETPRRLVVGLMDAGVQLAGEARLAYTTSAGDTGAVEDEIQPFAVAQPDALVLDASYTGLFPTILVAGVAIDL